MGSGKTPELGLVDQKSRGAYFTPPIIADYLADWAIESDLAARVLDPTCGEAVFLEAASKRLLALGAEPAAIGGQIFGVDVHERSLELSRDALAMNGVHGTFIHEDFFRLSTPQQLDTQIGEVDAVIGNPPFVRYQQHSGDDRKRARAAALAQGVRLSGLASSWAALLVHSCGFLKPDGRLAMVLPSELLFTGYAEPIRHWLKRRFQAVHLVMFEKHQFAEVQENVVLVLARGSGGCDAFTLVPVEDATDLADVRMFGPMHFSVAPGGGKWTDFLLQVKDRQIFERATADSFSALSHYGSLALGTVTGANSFFCISDATREEFEIDPRHLERVVPPGSKHLNGLTLTPGKWDALREANESVWILQPATNVPLGKGLEKYLKQGELDGVHNGFKCRARSPWYAPRLAGTPDLFFTYMSHRFPRLVANNAKAHFVNSMHGLTLDRKAPKVAKQALPLLAMNSVTMLGAELYGRTYGGGILKMEPSEASQLPVPNADALEMAWKTLRPDRARLSRQLESGLWTGVVKRVDEVLLREVCGLDQFEIERLRAATDALRERRIAS